MSTTIKFLNDKNKLITEQQANQLSEYSKLSYVDDNLKKEDVYYENKLLGGYYLSPEENVTEVLNTLGPDLNWAIKSNKQIANGYTIWEIRWYDENLQLKSKYAKRVNDSLGNHIATVMFDSITNQPKSAFKEFNFGGKHVPWDDEDMFFPEDAHIGFSFDDNGNIKRISMNEDLINNESNWTSLNKFLIDGDFFINQMMTQEQLYYFTHVEPVVPNF